ncbi:hypothetical protein MUN81_10415 [Hymenobacter sp. 5317J-9]|uniref:hypothetical protein n=1 Tax=Hymenobacter sp. 5317J-9 TaxID=2932250 RepID=UPI001FD64D58|nr:hypothetical protein [Hymenobacter sp. 5317J-9]UOQ99892.1 hypothetical protein MUN81_10415 [Hymenobacter sp. 5317J-9]
MAIDIDDIKTEYGNYYRDGGQNLSRVLKKPYLSSKTEALFGLIPTDDTSYTMAQTELSRVLQPFQPGWTPLGNFSASPIVLTQTPFKIDIEENPDKLEDSWLGFLADKNLDRAQWPFIRYVVEEHLFARSDEDYELNEIYFGKFQAPTPGTPGAAGTGMDGIRTVLNRAIQASKLEPIVMGAIPTDDLAFAEYVEAFVNGFSRRYRGRPMEVCMNDTLARRYAQGRYKKYKSDTGQSVSRQIIDGNGDTLLTSPIEFTKHQVVGLDSMGDSMKIWATPVENRKRLAKKTVNTKQVRIESAKRQVSIYTDFYKGVGFPVLEAVFTNEQDLTL